MSAQLSILMILSNRRVNATSLVHRHGEIVRSERIIGVALEHSSIFGSRFAPLSLFTQNMRQGESQMGSSGAILRPARYFRSAAR